MRLAMAELAALGLACAGATVFEAKAGSNAAHALVYDANWFRLLLGAVCATLVAAALARWPWRRDQTGFVATHFGIVILLAGAVTGRRSESSLRLHVPFEEVQMVFAAAAPVVVSREGPPSGCRVALMPGGKAVTVEAPSGGEEVLPLPAALGKPTALEGRWITVERYWADFVMKNGAPASRSDRPGNPAVLVRLSGGGSREAPGLRARLLRFEVARDEGTGAPADFRSTVRFSSPATGETLDAVISMNHPAHFPPGFWRTALGLNSTVFQAEWNPRDLGETTLWAVRDPGWPFKWIGSVMVCLGLAGVFYFISNE